MSRSAPIDPPGGDPEPVGARAAFDRLARVAARSVGAERAFVTIGDALAGAYPRDAETSALEGSSLVVPVRTAGESGATLVVVGAGDREWTDGDRAVLEDVAAAVATELELRFRTTLFGAQSDATMEGILVVSREGRMLSFNRRFLEMWDIPEDVAATRSDEAALESIRERLVDPEAFFARVAELYGNPEVEGRDEINLRDGRTFDRYTAPVTSPEGVHYGRVWFFQDVTERKRREKVARFLAEAGAALAESLDVDLTLTRIARLAVPRLADWCVVYLVDEQAGTIRRLAVAHAGGRDEGIRRVLEANPLDPGADRGIPRVIRTGRSELHVSITTEEIVGDTQDPARAAGELDPVGVRSAMYAPLSIRGRTFGAISFMAAESGRSYSEADLEVADELARRAALAVDNARLYREAEERAQAALVLETVGDGVFLVDSDGAVRLWNRAAHAITGLAPEDVRGRRLGEAVPGWAAIDDRIPTAPEPGAAVPAATVPLELRGRELWLSVSRVGFAEGTVYAFRDLTEERRVEQLKEDFVSTVSHELRTPLAAIYGAALTLRRGDLKLGEDERGRLLAIIADEADRLARTISDILWASQLDSGTMTVSLEPLDAAALALRAVEGMRSHLPATIRLELDAEEPVRVEADAQKVHQVLLNLLENAVKYSPDGGRVVVSITGADGRIRFSVDDEGLGIPRSERDRVFEKFYRLDPQLTRGVGGTGLGLYICRELVRHMGGRIWVDSEPGRGSTFNFELPAAG